MVKDIKTYVNNCEICKCSKPPNRLMKPPLGGQFNVERPWQRVYVDLLGPYPRSTKGKTLIFIILDHFTKFVILKTLSKATATNIVNCLKEELFFVHGVPEIIHSDNGGQFKSKEYNDLLKEFGIIASKTALYSPQSNLSERVNRSIIVAIRSYIMKNTHTQWDKYLGEIGSALRNAFHETVASTPHYLLYGYHKINHGNDYKLLRELDCISEGDIPLMLPDRMTLIHEEVKKNLKTAFEAREKHYNLRTRPIEFTPGQVVYVKQHKLSNAADKFTSKFAPQFLKFIISKKLSSVTYEVVDESGKVVGIYHAKDMKS